LRRFIVYTLGVLLAGGCGEVDPVEISQEEFFSLSVGDYFIYEIEEIQYSAFNPPVSLEYELRVDVVDSFINSEESTSFVISRSIRPNENDPWIYEDTWSTYFNGQVSIVNEGNIAYAKLQLPLAVGSSWDGNKFNILPEDLYRIESLNEPFSVSPEVTFENCAVINQSDERNLLFIDERVEVYAFNIGLVYKESNVVEFNTSGGLPGTQIIGGYYWKQVLLEYGQE